MKDVSLNRIHAEGYWQRTVQRQDSVFSPKEGETVTINISKFLIYINQIFHFEFLCHKWHLYFKFYNKNEEDKI